MSTEQQSEKKKTLHTKKTESVHTRLRKCQEELKEKDNKLLRSYADLQNLQKRMERELLLREEDTKIKYLSQIIDIKELLHKAVEDNNPKEGLQAIIKNLESFLEKEHVSYIDCVGKHFDHNCHHAISTVIKENIEHDTIVEEVKKGYTVGNKIIRPSQVIVGKKKNVESKEGT